MLLKRSRKKNIEHKGQPDSLGLELRRPWSRGNSKSEGANGDAIPQPSSVPCGPVLIPQTSRQAFSESLGRAISELPRQPVVQLR